jgi:D-3-phosphoglycerate dehydrogenase / 2-oxoglutarate reductase
MNWTVVNTLDLSGAPEAVAALEAAGRLVSVPPERAKVLPAMAEADAYLASASVIIDDEFLDASPQLRVIGSPSTGTDHMDLTAIDRRGIVRFDIAKEYDLINSFTATSELAFGLLLALNRRLKPAFAAADQGDWARERFTGFQLNGKTLGVLGLGRLGKISARIGQGFGMKVIAHDVSPIDALGLRMVDFGTLLAESDVLTIHVHLTRQTEGIIGERAFARMKQNAILLNTSRGRIVDEVALLKALEGRRIAGAGLDVIDGEWLTDEKRAAHPLVVYARSHDNLIISPHIGGATKESIYGARVFMARKVADWLLSQQRNPRAAQA